MTGIRFGFGIGLLLSTAAMPAFAQGGVWTNLAQAPASGTPQPAAEAAPAVQVLLERAEYWRVRDRPELAVEALERVLRSDPNNRQALHMMALLQAQQGNAQEARQHLQRLRTAHPGAGEQIAEVQRALERGEVSRAEITEARRLAETGSYDQAARRYQQAFRGAEPSGPYAIEYYQTLAGTEGGFEEARKGLEEVVRTTGGDPKARLALARTLTYRESTRREGIRQLQQLARDPAVGNEAAAAWRQAVLWLSTDRRDAGFYDAYLAAYPNDAQVRARREAIRATRAARAPSGPPPSVRSRMRGFDELNQGDLQQAEQRFSEALRLNRSDADALAGLGIVRLRQDRFEEARDLLGRAIGRSTALRRRYGEAYESAHFWAGMQTAEQAVDAGRYSQAESVLNDLLRRGWRESAAAQRLLADIRLRQGNEAAAERGYQAALRADPGDVAALGGLFNVYVAQNRINDALAIANRLEQASAGRPLTAEQRAEVMRLRARQHTLAGDEDAAFAAYQQAIVNDPSNPWLRLDFARFLARHGQREQADGMVQAMVDAGTAPPDALHAAAIYFQEREMLLESIAAIDRVPPAAQTAEMRRLRERAYLEAMIRRAKALAEAGNANEARRTLEDLLRTPPSTPEKAGIIAGAMADIGDTRRAHAILRPMIAGPNAQPATQLQYVDVLLKSGQEAEAAAFIRQLERAPGLSDAERRELAGKAADLAVMQADRAREARNFADAYDILYPHLAEMPDNQNLLLALARLYASAGRPEEARGIYGAVVERDPTSLDAIRGAVGAAIDARDYAYASALLDRAIDYHPREPRIYFLIGEVARAQGDMSTARRALETAQRLRHQELAAATAVGQPSGRLPSNPFRNLGTPQPFATGRMPQSLPPMPAAGASNPFRPASSATGQPPARRAGSGGSAAVVPFHPAAAAQLASTDPTMSVPLPVPEAGAANPFAGAQLAAAPEYSLPSAPSPRGGAAVDQADPLSTWVDMPPAGYRPAPSYPQPSYVQAPVYAPSPLHPIPPTYAPPPFADPAARSRRDPDSLTRDIQRSLAQVRRETGPRIEAGIKFRGRDGDSGLDRLNEVQAPLKATLSPGGYGRLTATVAPTYIDAGSISDDDLTRFGLNPLTPALDPGDQDDAGVGLSLGYAHGMFAVDAGVTPLGFRKTNFVGGASFTPMLDEAVGLKFTLEQRAVTDSLLSYAGAEDARGIDWGGVVRRGGRVEVNFDDGLVGAYAGGGFYQLRGEAVADNDVFETNVGGYYRFIRRDDEELKVGVNLAYMSYDRNLRHFTVGHGGYFSPQNYIAFSVPVEYIRTRDRLTYLLGGAIGVQDWSEDRAPVFPTDPTAQAGIPPGARAFYGGQDETNLGFNLRGQVEYDVSNRTAIGAAASFDNAADWFEATALVYLRHVFGWN